MAAGVTGRDGETVLQCPAGDKDAPPATIAGGLDDAAVAEIQKATDVGQTAWKPTTAQSATDLQKAERSIRGILNRLAPEKFEKLFEQLMEIVTSAETLRRTITLTFQKAVSEPTFTFLYADLCRSMSKELPEFPPPQVPTLTLTPTPTS